MTSKAKTLADLLALSDDELVGGETLAPLQAPAQSTAAPAPAAPAPTAPAPTAPVPAAPAVDPMGSTTGMEAPDPATLAGPEGTVPQMPQGGQQGGIMSAAGSVLSDIGTGLREAPKAALRGAITAGNQTLNAIDSAGDWLNQNVVDLGTPQLFNEKGEFDPKLRPSRPEDGISKNPIPNVAQPTSVTGNLVESASQFLVGMLGAQKITGLKGLYGGFVNGAVSDAVVFDPHQQRLSNFVEQVPALKNPVTDWLASKPEDPEALGRLKNAIEGAGLGALTEGVFYAIRAWRAGAQGNTKLADELMREADKVTPDDIGFKVPQVPEQKLTAANEPGKVVDAPMIDVKSVGKENPIPPAAANDMAPEPKVSMAPDAAAQKVEAAKPVVELDTSGRQKLAQTIADDIAQAKRASEVLGDTTVERATMGDMPKADQRRYDWAAVNDVDEFVATARATAKTIREQMSAGAPEGVVTWKDAQKGAKQLAAEYGADPSLFLGQLHRKAEDMRVVAEETVAFVTMTRKLNQEVTEIARAFTEGRVLPGFQSLDEMGEALERQAALFADVASSVQGIRTGFGRGLNVLKMADNVDPAVIWANKGKTGELASLITAMADDPAGMARALRKHYTPTTMDRVASYYSANLLASPDTHIINTLSNLARSFTMPAEKMIGGALSGNMDMVGVGYRQMVSMFSVIGDSLAASRRAFVLGRPILDPGSFKVAAGGAGEAATNRIFAPSDAWSSTQQLGAALANKLWQIQQLPHRMLNAEDEFFKQLSARSVILAEATQKGVKQGLDGDELKAFVKKELQASFDDSGALVNPKALDEARRATFTEELGQGWLQDVQVFLAKNPAARVLALPFFKTPVNLFRQSVRWTPGLNFAVRDVRTRFAAGGEERARVLGEMGMGAMIWSTAVSMALAGKITHGGPIGDKQQMKLRDSGWRPYSVKTENEDGSTSYIPLNNAEPFGLVLGLAADLTKAYQEIGEGAAPDLEDAAMAVFWSITRNVQDRNFFQGFANLLGAVNREGDSSGLKKMFGSIASGFVPWGSGVNYINQWNDPVVRDARTITDRVLARIPGFSDQVPARRTWLGEEVDKQPRLMSTQEPDKLTEIYNTAIEATGKAPEPPSPLMYTQGRRAKIDLREFKLKDGRVAYDVMMEYLQQPGSGPSLREAMEKEADKPSFEKLKDGPSTEAGTKLSVLIRIRKSYMERAKVQLLKKHPEVREEMRKAHDKAQGIYDARLRLIQQYGETDEAGDE